ncbi:MAG: transporter substrate-binding domain-containing protein [Spirochaetaceae bacterium]|jgi:L-cystine transport system substrate-binding protein|nr:transporter substrate-binding domain-containing protein [Spirochaetaceae bacterium]
MKKALVFVIVLAVAGQGLVYATGSAEQKGSGDAGKVTKIVVGTGNKYEPYCYADAQGNLIGYDYKVLEEVDRRLPQYEFTYEVFDFANILIALGTGKVDIGAHEYEENPERRAAYLYGDERYSDYDSWLTVNADGPWANVNSVDELAGNPNAVFGVSLGSNHEAFARTYNRTHDAAHQLTIQTYTENAVWGENLKSGRFSAGLSMLVDIDRYIKITPGLNLIPRGDKPVIESGAYFIFAKNNPALKEAVDGALRDMKADGTLTRIYKEAVLDYYANL